MTRILVLGATGRAGSAVLTELPDDVQTTAALRRPNDARRLPETAVPVDRAVVDVDDTASLHHAAQAAEVIINAIRLREDIPPTALVDLHQRIAAAGRPDRGAAPLIVTVGGAGALRLADGSRFWQHPGFPERTLPRGRAHAQLRDHLEAGPSVTPWTYLIPPPAFDPDGPRTGHHTAWEPSDGESAFTERAISYADFATAVAQAALKRETGTRLIAWP